MHSEYHVVAEEAGSLARHLPFSAIAALASLLEQRDLADWTVLRNDVGAILPNPHYRAEVARFLETWESRAKDISPRCVAVALWAVAATEVHHREHQSVELVWTGPDVGLAPVRHTEQVIQELISSAVSRLTVVSYAVFNVPRICDDILRAADRGVNIRLVLESPDRLEGQSTYSNIAALGPSIANRCAVFLWPQEKRIKGESGRTGILHVKCAMADGRLLFLSSANLTEYAFTLNMELGLLIRGGPLPGQVESYFESMIQTGILSPP